MTKHPFFNTIVGIIIGSFITIFGGPYINNIFEESKIPLLVKELHSTNIVSLPEEIQKQITVITTQYALSHYSGGTSENITIQLESKDKIDKNNLIINNKSESNSIKQINDNQIEINIPSIRPKGIFSFEITHSPTNKITWNELIKTGKINNIQDLPKDEGLTKNNIILAIFMIFSLAIIIGLAIIFIKYTKILTDMEKSGKDINDKQKELVITMLSISLIYNIFININGNIPSIPITEIFYTILLYLLIVNFGTIKKKYL